jgi:hypothetical protein
VLRRSIEITLQRRTSGLQLGRGARLRRELITSTKAIFLLYFNIIFCDHKFTAKNYSTQYSADNIGPNGLFKGAGWKQQ